MNNIYIGNAFSPNMVEDNTLTMDTITKQEFLEAAKTGKSIIGHPEIAEHFQLTLNRESITLNVGDTLYVVTPNTRPKAQQLVENGAKYEFVPETEGYRYTKIKVIE